MRMNLRPSWAGNSDRAIEIAFKLAAKATIKSSNRRPAMPILLDLEPKQSDALQCNRLTRSSRGAIPGRARHYRSPVQAVNGNRAAASRRLTLVQSGSGVPRENR
jgi:hypothetical protein